MTDILTRPPAALQALLADAADRLARATRFVTRLRRVTPAAFARAFALVLISHPRASLEQLAAELGVTASALGQRLRLPAAARFLRALLRDALGRLADAPPPAAVPLLRRFNGVFLADCTCLALPDALAGRFPGCGGAPGRPKAAAKVLARMELGTGRAADLLVAPARTPDARLLRRLPAPPPGALHVADLGFFDSKYLAALTRRGVHWLTRLPARVSVRAGGGAWRELAAWLRGLGPGGFDGPLLVCHKTPMAARVLAARCPAAEAARRRRRLRARARREGREPGWRQLALCDWWVLATDLPAEGLTAAAAAALYRARWQVELLFKRWKSLGRLGVGRRLSAGRAACELFGRLLGVLVVGWLALRGGGPLSGRSAWRAFQAVVELLPLVCWALRGRVAWGAVLGELAGRLARRPGQPRRRGRPGTRERLAQATNTA
jgi:hypothetical protein